MILFENVSKHYNKTLAVQNLSFEIESHELVFLTGHSGAGKSTVLKLIALIERASQGEIFIEGRNLKSLSLHDIPYLRRCMGMVFQNPRLLNDRTVFDNVALPLNILGMSHSEIGRRVRAALDKVGLLSKEKRMPDSLSSGEQQRVGIARAVVHKPKILLADEPTGNLDPDLSEEIMHIFEQFQSVGTSVVIASHDLELISRLNHPTLQLHQGKLYETVS